jgi:hypothetical protein
MFRTIAGELPRQCTDQPQERKRLNQQYFHQNYECRKPVAPSVGILGKFELP